MLSVSCRSCLFQVEIYKSFRPGDIVLAKVVSFNEPLDIELIPQLFVISEIPSAERDTTALNELLRYFLNV